MGSAVETISSNEAEPKSVTVNTLSRVVKILRRQVTIPVCYRCDWRLPDDHDRQYGWLCRFNDEG